MPQYQNKLNLINQELGRLGQDKITDDVLARIVRNNNPDFYKDWSNEAIVDAHLWQIPELRNKVRVRTPGERAFDTSGSSAAPNFAEQVLFQSQNMLRTAKAGAIGMLSPDTEVGENARKVAEFAYENKIRDNQKLQALVAWKEKEAGWSGFDTTMRSLAEALPSLAMSVGAGVAAYYAAPATGGASVRAWAKWGIPAMTLAPIGVMEATSTYVDIMKDLVDDEGLTPSEARKYAYLGTSMYTPVSLFFERMGGKAFAKVGGMGTPAFDVGLRKSLTKKMVKYGLDDKRFAEVGARGVTTLANSLITATTEGTTEFAQSVWQQTVQGGIKNNVGRNQEEVITAYNKAFQESWMNKQSLEEGYAGVSTGLLGLFGLKNKVSRNLIGSDVTSEDISETLENQQVDIQSTPIEEFDNIRRPELLKIAKDEGLKNYSKLNIEPLKQAIIDNRNEVNRQKIKEQKEEEVSTPKASSNINSRYLDELVDPSNMQEVLDEASNDTTSDSKAVLAASTVKGVGNKILRMIKETPNIIDTILKSKNKKQLLLLARDQYNEIVEKSPNIKPRDKDSMKLGDSESEIIKGLRDFEERGTIREIESDLSDPSDADIDSYFDMAAPEVEIRATESEPDSVGEFEDDPNSFAFEANKKSEAPKTQEAPKTGKQPSINDTLDIIADKIIAGEKLSPQESNIMAKKGRLDKVEAIIKNKSEDIEVGTAVVSKEEIKTAVEELSTVDDEVGTPIIPKNPETNFVKKLKKGDKVKVNDEFFDESKVMLKDDSLKKKIKKVAEKGAEFEVVKVNKKTYSLKDKKSGQTFQIPFTWRNKSNKTIAILSNLSDKNDNLPLPYSKNPKKELESYTVKDLIDIIDQRTLIPTSKKKEDLINQILKDDAERAKAQKWKDNPKVSSDKAPKSITKFFTPVVDLVKKSKQTVETYLKVYGARNLGGEIEFIRNKNNPNEFLVLQTGKDGTKAIGYLSDKNPGITNRDDRYAFKLNGIPQEASLYGIAGNNKEKMQNDYGLTWEGKIGGDERPFVHNVSGAPIKPTLSKESEVSEPSQEELFDEKSKVEDVTQEEVDTAADNYINEEDSDLTDNKDLDADLQTENSSKEILITENTELAEKILSRLKRHFPFVDTKTFEGVMTLHGKKVIGFAMERLAAWSKTDARMDTMPHEYAHIYIKLFRNDPLVKKAIKKFGSEEKLVKYIGMYYANRARETSVIKRVKIWLKQFANRLKRYFGGDVSNLEQFIAEEFYEGKFLGMEATVGDQFIDFMEESESEEDAISGNEKGTDFTNVAGDHHMANFYHDALGIYIHKTEHYPQLVEIARNNNTFEQYMEEMHAWATKIADERGTIVAGKIEKVNNILEKTTLNGREVFKLQTTNPSLYTQLNMDWVKSLAKRDRYNIDDKTRRGKETRIYQQYTIRGKTANSQGDGIRLTGLKSRITNKKFSSTVVSNFFEDQLDTESRLQILPIKEIARTNINKDKDERFWTRANFSFTKGELKMQAQLYANQHFNMVKKRLDIDNFKGFSNIIKKPFMSAVVGSKLGDNASVISTIIPKRFNPLNITVDGAIKFFENELNEGNINQKHYNDLTEGFEKLRKNKNPLMHLTLKQFVAKHKKDGKKAKEIRDIVLKHYQGAIGSKAFLSTNIARYVAWQELRTPDYLIYENSVADSMTRLSIDLAEGPAPRGLGDTKLMVVPTDAKVQVKADGEWVDAGIYDDFDGATFTGSIMLKKIGRILGLGKLNQLKTFIRQRAVNEDGTVDYLGMKHMQFTPHKDMRFYDSKTNEMVAQVITTKSGTRFENAFGESFEMIASPNEAKMMFGSKHRDENGELKFYEMQTINEESIKIHDVQRKSKLDASHPIALGEMLLSAKSKEAKALLEQIKIRYGEAANHYSQKINAIFEDSASFNQFIKEEKREGKIPLELDRYISLLKKDGRGIHHPNLISHLLPIINNRFIKNGLLKARAVGKSGSKVYLKPAVHLGIDVGSVMLSSENSVGITQVEKAYKKANNITGKLKAHWDSVIDSELNQKHEKIKILNDFLINNEVNVLIHRNPIAKITGVVQRRVQRIHEGSHGETMFLNFADVKDVLDGDWDGDTTQFEFISKEYSTAMTNWQNSKEYESLNKVVSLNIFDSRTDKPKIVIEDGKEKTIETSVSSLEDIENTISENAKLDGSTGYLTNAKTILAQLFNKDFKLYHKDLEDKKAYLRARNPEDRVTMSYYKLNRNNLNEDEYNQLVGQGDLIVDSKGKEVSLDYKGDMYLNTTVSHELSILFQMAVDSGKYDIWGKVLNDSGLSPFHFMLSKIFEVSDGSALFTQQGLKDKSFHPSKMMGMLSLVYSEQNISQRRAGINEESAAGRAASFDTNILQSEQLSERHFEDGKSRTNSDYSEQFFDSMKYKDQAKEQMKYDSDVHGEFYGKKLSMKNNISPAELLITKLAEGMTDSDLYRTSQNPNAHKAAHVIAAQDLLEYATSLPFWNDLYYGKLTKDFKAAHDFLYAKKDFNGEVESFADAWATLKDSVKDINNIQADLNDDFIGFTERYIEQWNKLSEPSQVYATFKMISGLRNDIHISKLPPLALMNDKIIAAFLPLYEKNLLNHKKDIADMIPRQIRELSEIDGNTTYWNVLANIHATYAKDDDKLEVCPT